MDHQLWPIGQAVKTPPFHGGNRGSIPLGVTICGLIAQLGEHLPYKQGVTGSSPVGPTIKQNSCGCSSVVEPRPSKPVARVRSPSPAPDDPLAQSAEHLTFNQGVPRSSRGWVTNFQKKLLTNTAKRSILIKSPKQGGKQHEP